MPQSHSFILVHYIWSTKDRRRFIETGFQPRLHAYLATVTRDLECGCFRVGGTEDHVHLAVRQSRKVTAADFVEKVKVASSRWAKENGDRLDKCAWQRGYGVFSVGPKDLDALVAYIDGQEEHHREVTFQEEYRKFLRQYGIEYDERYAWN